jgi:hypothetical protein
MDIRLTLAAAIAIVPLAACETMQAPPPWKAQLKCNASGDLQAFTVPLKVSMKGNEFFLENGSRAQPGYTALRGLHDPDDRLQLTGEVAPPGGKAEKATLEGRRDGLGLSAYGRAGRQNCSVTIQRESAPETPGSSRW